MYGVLFVGLGGALGAVLRFLLSSVPLPAGKADFPFWTLIINFLGSVIIGIVVGFGGFGSNGTLFWKTGVCGGFTTFSAFSLEACSLFEAGRTLLASVYIVLSVGLCLLGVMLGKALGALFVK